MPNIETRWRASVRHGASFYVRNAASIGRDRESGHHGAVPAVADEKVIEASMKPSAKVTKKEPPTTPEAASKNDSRITALLRAFRADPRFAPVVAAYEKQAGEPGRKFGKNGLKTKGGKLFALFTQGTLVVKLPNERVAGLVARGIGKQFDPGRGRLMKGWLTITSPKASWVELAKEAHEFVQG
jgi:hypothetical protein